MLKQILKENIKAILSENKEEAMSLSVAVLIRTLEGNPEMVKSVYNLCRTAGVLMQSEPAICVCLNQFNTLR